jgi:hypothetical protein
VVVSAGAACALARFTGATDANVAAMATASLLYLTIIYPPDSKFAFIDSLASHSKFFASSPA